MKSVRNRYQNQFYYQVSLHIQGICFGINGAYTTHKVDCVAKNSTIIKGSFLAFGAISARVFKNKKHNFPCFFLFNLNDGLLKYKKNILVKLRILCLKTFFFTIPSYCVSTLLLWKIVTGWTVTGWTFYAKLGYCYMCDNQASTWWQQKHIFDSYIHHIF